MYIDEATLQNYYGTAQVAALCPTAGELNATIELATADVESALRQGGYEAAVPSTVYGSIGSVPIQIKLATYGQWLQRALLRRGIHLPESDEHLYRLAEEIREGRLGIEGVSVNTTRAVGGVVFTDSSSDADTARPQIFSRENWSDW